MRVIEYDGQCYRSIGQACKALKISYQKLRRLCRHYRRAAEDPAVAIRWILGIEKMRPDEPKTWKYAQDMERGRERQQDFKARMQERAFNLFQKDR